MNGASQSRSPFFFCLRFLLYVIVLVVLWWEFVPVYGMLLIQAAGGILKYLLGVPITHGYVKTSGILNTNSLLVFGVEFRESSLAVVKLITNVPPYVALILATPDLGWRRKLKVTLAGLLILCVGHVLYLLYALKFQLAASGEQGVLPEISSAIVQFYLTLPFLLWIVFAYWDRIAGYLAANAEAQETAKATKPEDAR